MEPVRFGLAGYGFGGRYFHAPLLATAAGCEFLGVVTTSAERRELVARDHTGLATFDSLEELAAAGAEAVAVSTPASTHTALTEQALELGLAVVCDKPFALDAPSARHTVELAERLGLPLAPYQNRRWDSDFLTARALADDGALGTVARFESRFERSDPEPGPPAAGGGTLLDFGSHLVDQALVLLGPVASVYAEWRVRGNGVGDDVFGRPSATGGGGGGAAWPVGGPPRERGRAGARGGARAGGGAVWRRWWRGARRGVVRGAPARRRGGGRPRGCGGGRRPDRGGGGGAGGPTPARRWGRETGDSE